MTSLKAPLALRAILAANAIGIGWMAATPAEAQFVLGGSPSSVAINQSVGHVAARQQQLSFEGVQAILQGRRDQLQGTSAGRPTTSSISGYSSSEFDESSGALGYAGPSRGSNPLASPVYKAPPLPANSGPSLGAWAQGLGDWERDNASSAADVGHFASTYGAQAGVDATWQNLTGAGDAGVLGLVGGWTNSHASYDGTPTTMRLSGPGVGVYGNYVKGSFSVDLTTKFDFLQMTQDFAGVAPNASVTLTNAGVSGNMQYKVALGGSNFVEPTGGFSFTRTMFGSGAAAIGLTDASTLRLQAGARWGTTWQTNGVSVEPSLKALVYSNVVADGTSAATAALAGLVPTDQGKVRGQLNPGVDWNFGNGYSASLAGSVRFGEGLLGGSASLNLRKQW